MRGQKLIALTLLLAAGCEGDALQREPAGEVDAAPGAEGPEAEEGGQEDAEGLAPDAQPASAGDASVSAVPDACARSEAACSGASQGVEASAAVDASAELDVTPDASAPELDASVLDAAVAIDAALADACAPSVLGPLCRSDLALVRFAGNMRYERRPPRPDLRDFAAPESVPGRGLVVAAYRGDTLIDAVLSSDDSGDPGSFVLRVPTQITPSDRLVVLAAMTDASGHLIAAVADPGHGASTRVHTTDEAAPDARVWSFAFPLSLLGSGQTLTIPGSAGSAALHVFDSVRRVVRDAAAVFRPPAPASVLVWLGLGTLWDCGSCVAQDPVQQFGQRFLHQLWIDGSSDEAYWSDALVTHELGHYLLAAYSEPPSEAGPHYVGVPTQPGLAWSEGFATFYSSLTRDDPLYFDKQEGVFFWFRIDARSYGPDLRVWQRPEAARGLFQRIDENEVAALLWGVHERVPTVALIEVLGSPRLREAPFERGYTERRWTDAQRPEDYQDTRLSHVMLADYFDALRCTGAISAALLDQVTEPSTHFPYPSESPRCR